MSSGATRRLTISWSIILLALISSKYIVQAVNEENIEIEGGSFEYNGDLGNNIFDQNSGGGFNGGGGGFSDNGPILDYDPNGPFGGGGGGGSFDASGGQMDDFQMMPLAAGNSLSSRGGNRLANGSSNGFANGSSDGFLNANRNVDRRCDDGGCGGGGGYRFITGGGGNLAPPAQAPARAPLSQMEYYFCLVLQQLLLLQLELQQPGLLEF